MSGSERSMSPPMKREPLDDSMNGNNGNGAYNGYNDKERSRSPKKRKSHRRSRSRSRSRSRERRSRSRSNHRSHRPNKKRSRSRSRSPSPRDQRRYSRSPSYGKPRYSAREAPPASRCLGVFGMSVYTDEKQLNNYFSQFGKIEEIQIIYDKKTGRSRGFAFIYFAEVEDAVVAKERAVGKEIDGQRVRIDFSITKGPHNPTPGLYMGRRRDGHEDYGRGGGGGGGWRSPGGYRRRSRSYSPRR